MDRWDNLYEPRGLTRDPYAGWVSGVCAGIAQRLTINPFIIRLLFILLTLGAHIIGVLLYVVLTISMKPRRCEPMPTRFRPWR